MDSPYRLSGLAVWKLGAEHPISAEEHIKHILCVSIVLGRSKCRTNITDDPCTLLIFL